jgi:hypothetical protein
MMVIVVEKNHFQTDAFNRQNQTSGISEINP